MNVIPIVLIVLMSVITWMIVYLNKTLEKTKIELEKMKLETEEISDKTDTEMLWSEPSNYNFSSGEVPDMYIVSSANNNTTNIRNSYIKVGNSSFVSIRFDLEVLDLELLYVDIFKISGLQQGGWLANEYTIVMDKTTKQQVIPFFYHSTGSNSNEGGFIPMRLELPVGNYTVDYFMSHLN